MNSHNEPTDLSVAVFQITLSIGQQVIFECEKFANWCKRHGKHDMLVFFCIIIWMKIADWVGKGLY
jgi:hypothetical protein